MNTDSISTSAPAGRFSATVRLVATPLTVATFLVCGGTGLALFFEVHSRAMKELHEWSGIGMCAAVVLHLIRNWNPTLTLFRRWPVWVALGGAAIASVWVFLVTPAGPPRGRGGPGAPGAEGPGAVERTSGGEAAGRHERGRGDGHRHERRGDDGEASAGGEARKD